MSPIRNHEQPTDVFPEVYHHFRQPDYSSLSMKVRILEKIYHPSNNPILSTPLKKTRRQKEEFESWVLQCHIGVITKLIA